MTHTLKIYENGIKELSLTELENKKCLINITCIVNNSFEEVEIIEQLHSFIGTLLQVQQKMKGGK